MVATDGPPEERRRLENQVAPMHAPFGVQCFLSGLPQILLP
jgi:hypothetical protein